MEQAIYKMSTGAAQLYGLSDRGQLSVGAAADFMVFDPAAYQPMATYDNPRQYARGVRHVLINGTAVLKDHTFFPDRRPGRTLHPRA
jgi:N-acyl-D-amino-acid deacylase